MKTTTATIYSFHELQELIKQLELNNQWYYIHQETAPYIIEYQTA
jgi:hypothetical protein